MNKMKMLCVFGMLALQACAAEPADKMEAQAVSTDPYHWMVGTWACKTKYHQTDEAHVDAEYQMDGVYTAVEDGNDVIGEYREKADGQHETSDYNDLFEIRQPLDELKVRFNPGLMSTRYTAKSVPGSERPFSIEAEAGVHLDGPGLGNNGVAAFGGQVSLPDEAFISFPFEEPRCWSGLDLMFRPSNTPGVTHLLLDGRVQIPQTCQSCGSILMKVYKQSDCLPAPDA